MVESGGTFTLERSRSRGRNLFALFTLTAIVLVACLVMSSIPSAEDSAEEAMVT
jgi:hypothetical protein